MAKVITDEQGRVILSNNKALAVAGGVTDVTVGGTSVVNASGVADISIDSTPTANSTNLVTSGGIYTAIISLQTTILDAEYPRNTVLMEASYPRN